MKATITSIELKGPLQFFALSISAWKVMKQLKSSSYKDFRKKGFWTKHYTMTLWNSEDEMKAFAFSGAHIEAMKHSKQIAKEIKTITVDVEKLPSWAMAQELLKQGKSIQFS